MCMCRKLGFFCVSVYIVAHCRIKRIIQNLCHMLPQLAKAPAKVLTEHRNALAKEQGSKRQLTLQNASRHYKRTVWRYAFAMGIPISTYVHEEDGRSVAIEWLRPSDILRFLLNKYPSLLLGGCKPGVKAEAMLASFWKQYQLIDPNHALFDGNPPDLHRTIPLNLHGDGARTQKKQPLEVVSLEAVLGIDSYKCKQCHCDDCNCPPTTRRAANDESGNPFIQLLNHKNHTYLSRFLVFAFPSKEIKMPGLLEALLKETAADLGGVCTNGINTDHGFFRVGVLGYKGDMEYHKKLHLQRSYANVGHVNAIQCCHECKAGDALHPFEDSNDQASWVSTRCLSLPWTDSPFTDIPFADWSGARDGRASLFFRRDTFHIFRLGIARNFIASVIIMLGLKGVFDDGETDFSVERRLNTAWHLCNLWCTTNGTRPATVRSFTREKLHYKSGSYPWIACKGADTVIFLTWLRFQIRLIMPMHVGDSLEPTLRMMLLGVQAGLSFTKNIHRHGLWMQVHCVKHMRNSCSSFLRAYAVLAQTALQEGVSLFGMVPKYHAMAHYKIDANDLLRLRQLLADGAGGQEVLLLNPAAFDCSGNEDFVGRISKQSRRIGFKKVLDNLMRAYLVKFKFVAKRHFEQRQR